MDKRIALLALLICLTAVGPTMRAQVPGLEKLDFFIGEWALETMDIQPDGSYAEGKARSEVKYILDGHAVQDDFLVLGDDDTVLFRGTSIRSYNPRSEKFQIVWIMPGYKGLTDIIAEWKDGKLISTGKGYDVQGEFLERFEYYDITEVSYSFRMDRSYDNGATWIKNFALINAKRIK